MYELRENILKSYYCHNYEYCIILFNKYLKYKCGIDYKLIYCYIISLINLRRFDEAYEEVKWLEKNNAHPNVNFDIFTFYLFCFKPEDALRVLNAGNINISNKSYVVKAYLLQGRIEEAKKLIVDYLNEGFDLEVRKLWFQICNHENKGAFIEMDYESFTNKGNELEPGHIIYLKQSPESLTTIENDPKSATRPYMIWKCVGEKVYLFPVSTSKKKDTYVLYAQKYPNSVGDRIIKSNLCSTSKSNILSVYDKVREEDLNVIFTNIYNAIYLNRTRDTRDANYEFLKEFHHEVTPNMIIVLADQNTGERKYFFVIDTTDDYYKLVEIDANDHVISDKVEMFRKDRLFYKGIRIPEEKALEIREELPKNLTVSSFVGARIEYFGSKYIVLEEKNDDCLCIEALYSPSYISIKIIKKRDIKDTFGYLSEEEVENLKGMVQRNAKKGSVPTTLKKRR